MRVTRWPTVLLLSASVLACEAAEPAAATGAPGLEAPAREPPPAGPAELAQSRPPATGTPAPSATRIQELRQLADDYLHEELGPGDPGTTLDQIRALPPVDGRAFRTILMEKDALSGVPREVYDAMTDVAFENGTSAFDLDATLTRQAVRRALEPHLRDWGHDRVEETIERYVESLGVN
jgi:hypothetical protein